MITTKEIKTEWGQGMKKMKKWEKKERIFGLFEGEDANISLCLVVLRLKFETFISRSEKSLFAFQ